MVQATTRRPRLAACAHIGERVLEFEQCIFGGRVPVYACGWCAVACGVLVADLGSVFIGCRGSGPWGSG